MNSNNYGNDWREVSLKDYIVAIESGKRPKGGAISEGIPSLGGEHIDSDGGFKIKVEKLKYIPKEFYEKMTNGIIEKGDILVVKDGATTGKIAYVKQDFPLNKACINEHIFLLRTNENLESRYLSYYLRSELGQRNIMNDFRGATVGGISKGFINFKMFLPPLETQKKIVEILEKAEKALEKRKEANKLLDELVKSRFIEQFGDPVSNPKGWNIVTLEEATTFMKDGPHSSPKYVEKGIPFISVNNIIKNKWDLENVKYISEENHKLFSKRCKPEKGDILYTKGGTTGFAKYVDIDLEFSNWVHVAVLKYDKEKINGIFLTNMLNSDYCYQQSQKYTRGIANRDLVLGQMKLIKLFMPDIVLQNKFAEFFNQVDKLKFEMESSLKGLQDNFNSLMQKAFNGELFN